MSKISSAPNAPRKRTTTPRPAREQTNGHAHVIADTIWMVLARRGYDEALRDIGTVAADDPELAKVYARTIFDEFAWIEMVVVPRSSMVPVIES